MYLVTITFYFAVGLFITYFRQSGVDFISFILSPCKGKKRIINKEDKLTDGDSTENHQEISQSNQEKKNKNDFLTIQTVTRYYGSLTAVNNFTGEIYGGEIFCLLGHNGAGKTTLIKMISGIEDPDKGDIFLGSLLLLLIKTFSLNTLVFVHRMISSLTTSPLKSI